jgi:uncharacterized integral membrane protein (TIGR00697 family)
MEDITRDLGWFWAQQQGLLWLAVVCGDLCITIAMYRLFGKTGLYAVVVLDIMLGNLIGGTITTVFGMKTSMGAIIYAGIYFATDLLGEKYGAREANRAVLLGFAVSLIVTYLGLVCLLFEPTTDPKTAGYAAGMHAALAGLFNVTPRVMIGSLFAYLVSQSLDVWLFHRLKRATNGKHLWLRNNVSTLASQAVDTALFSTVVWWGFFDFWTAVELASAKYVFKFAIAIIDTPFIYWARSWDVSDKDWEGTVKEEADRYPLPHS